MMMVNSAISHEYCYRLLSNLVLYTVQLMCRVWISVEIYIRVDSTSLTVTEGGSVEVVIEKVGETEEPVTIIITTHSGSADSQSCENTCPCRELQSRRLTTVCIYVHEKLHAQ